MEPYLNTEPKCLVAEEDRQMSDNRRYGGGANGGVPPPYDVAHRIYSNPAAGGNDTVYYNDQSEEGGCCSCLGRVPWLTLLGVILVAVGSSFLMLGYKTFAPGVYDTYEAVNFKPVMEKEWSKKTADFIEKEAEQGKDSYYSPENPQYIILDSCLAGAGSLFLLVVALMSSGLTRKHCCEARSCCQGYCLFVHFTTGLVVMILMLAFFSLSLLLILPLLFSLFLDDSCAPNQTTRPCFNSMTFGLTLSSDTTYNGTQICFGDDGFCPRLDNLQRGFIYWCSGGFGAALGMIIVLMSHAANFAHFWDMKKNESEEKYVF
ncbi:uncharacterized protein LOC134844297 isoform X2 [Symsagittifera roscoffensis]|uniref:uncharacterized protein LOC134844297 isoform X2 n=1 Tax=Symsagittifera roscoffensis TaxID=84072 RepID=UPI00307CC58E